MSLFEFWGERVDPGEVGSFEVGAEHVPSQWLWLTVARFAFVAVALPLVWWFSVPLVPLPLWQSAGLIIGGTLIYVALGYLLRPEPNLDNIGWFGGMMDHPWRFSDDLNRWLLLFQIVLGPGRFVAESVIDFAALFQGPADEYP
jgi:hypothetical protein